MFHPSFLPFNLPSCIHSSITRLPSNVPTLPSKVLKTTYPAGFIGAPAKLAVGVVPPPPPLNVLYWNTEYLVLEYY
jgi:hypothetical protein